MATYASYRHIELDKVGYSKKRVRNPSSEIFNVMSTSNPCSPTSCTPNRSRNSDSFNRLFGNAEPGTPRRSSISKLETSPRNPVTGDGVISWDSKISNRNTPRPLRNPVTGESYTIQKSPVSTPKKSLQNGYQKQNGLPNGLSNGHVNGHSIALQNGHSNGTHESPMLNGKA